MNEISYWFNAFEAILWSGIAVALFAKNFRQSGRMRTLARIAAVAFLLFGISDLIELKTGAWWRPIWLFLLKAGCVITLLGCLIAYYKMRKPSPKSDSKTKRAPNE